MRQIPYGKIDFKDIIENNYLYVDKTIYLEKLEATPDLSTVFYLRPGRFGKSLFTSMLNYYYDVDYKNQFDKLFGNLYIGKNPTKNKNKYYCLSFDFSGLTINEEDNIKSIQEAFNYKVFRGINTFEKKYKINANINENLSADKLIGNIFDAFKIKKPNDKIYIIIDEYDNFTNGILKDNADKFLNVVAKEGFVKSFYEVIKQGVKDGVVHRFFATGIAPITLDSMTTGFNIATDISRNPKFTSMIGLTEEEVKNIMDEIFIDKNKKQKEEIYNEMKDYYNGYRFSELDETKTFNTTLVMYYLKEYLSLNMKPVNMLDSNITYNFDKLKNIINLKHNPYSKKTLTKLINGEDIYGTITNKFNLDMDLNQNDILSMLFYFGYATIGSNDILDVNFKIPNYVMEKIYNEYFMYLINIDGFKTDYNQLNEVIMEFAKEGKIDKLCQLTEKYLSYEGNISFERYDEKYIKSYMLSILISSNRFRVYLEYPIINNKYADIVIFKEIGSYYDAIIEVKYLKKKEKSKKNIKNKKEEAIKQIKEYSQDKRLPKDIKKFVVVFAGNKLEVLEEV